MRVADLVDDDEDVTEALPDNVGVVVTSGAGVVDGDAVTLMESEADDVDDVVAEADGVAVDAGVRELESVVEGVGDGVVVAATGAGAMPRNWKPGAAVAIGTPPFV